MTEEINNWLNDLCFYDGAESTEEIQEEPDINCDYEEHIRCFWGLAVAMPMEPIMRTAISTCAE